MCLCVFGNVYFIGTCTVAKAVCVINQAVESGDPEATLAALQAPAANIRSVTEECAADYTSSLAVARREKEEQGGEDGEGWMEHRTREGHAFYYNWRSERSQWEKPDALPEQSSQLRRDEIQVKPLIRACAILYCTCTMYIHVVG